MTRATEGVADVAGICSVVDACGGCPFYALSEADERSKKIADVSASLRRALGKSPRIGWVQAPSRTGYRNRIRLRVQRGGLVTFFNEHKENGCAALERTLRVAVDRVRAIAAREPSAFAPVAHIEVRKPDRHGHASVFLVTRTNIAAADDAKALLDGEFIVAAAGSDGRGETRTQDYDIREGTFARIPLGRFMQVNSSVNTLLVDEVVRRASASGAKNALDLFAGSGNFALPLSQCGIESVAVEVDADAVAAMRDAAREQGLVLDALAVDARAQVAAWSNEGRAFDVVLVDAPRAGLKNGHASVARLATHTLAICSCAVDTFAEDCARFVEAGFRVVDVSAFDMFPGTAHLELFGWLEK